MSTEDSTVLVRAKHSKSRYSVHVLDSLIGTAVYPEVRTCAEKVTIVLHERHKSLVTAASGRARFSHAFLSTWQHFFPLTLYIICVD